MRLSPAPRVLLAAVCLLLLPTFVAAQLGVTITSPTDGADVAGLVGVSGTSSGLVNGKVSVSIDGGAFQLATGVDPWSFGWDATGASPGAHTITARARECLACPPVFDSITVQVVTDGPSVSILQPGDGATVLDTLTVLGTSSAASSVSLRVDGGPAIPANGLAPWTVVLEEGSMSPGPHVLTAEASDGASSTTASVTITVGDPPAGQQEFTYVSSVDGVAMTSKLWVPAGFDPDGGDLPLLVHLHGGGGNGTINASLGASLDAWGWLGIGPDGRAWGLADEGCTWQTSAAYVDNPDPLVGPGEQDIFDAIAWAMDNYPVDEDRIYLTGFSMGGRGTYAIGLKNPDVFAAIGPRGPASDMYEIFVRRAEPCECKEGMTGGSPGDSPFVDTMYTITSARFLIENAYNLPVFHGHGNLDTVASNTPVESDYLHGWHMTDDTSFADPYVTPPDYANSCLDDPGVLPLTLDFGHTPTLSELAARHPDAYDWAFMFTDVGHTSDPKWFTGGPDEPGDFGVPDPDSPGDLLGMFEFFSTRSRVHSPDTVVFKSYTDTHTAAYWVDLLVSTPWLDIPGAVRATRDVPGQALAVELVRADRVAFDLDRAGYDLASDPALSVSVDILHEPVYDPALAPGAELQLPTLVFQGDFSGWTDADVRWDGAPLDPALVTLGAESLEVGPLLVDGPHVLDLADSPTGWSDLGFALAGGAGEPLLSGTGNLTGGSPTSLDLTNAAPTALAVLFLATSSSPVPFKGGTLAAFPFASSVSLNTDASGALPLAFGWPSGVASGSVLVVQYGIADAGAPLGVALSNALLGTTP